MDCKIALFDLRGTSPSEKPLMLGSVLFCPVLHWVCRELSDRGVERYFILCDEPWRDEVTEALGSCAERAAVFTDPSAAADAVDGDALVFPVPVLPLPAFGERADYALSADVLRRQLSDGKTARPADADEGPSFLPFRSAAELQRAMPLCRELVLGRLAQQGVTVIDPMTTYVDPRCTVSAGTTILPGTILRGETHVAANCEIGPNAMIRDSSVGEGTTVNASQVNESTVGCHTTVGPFTYVRPNCTIGDHCRVGDFVEVKNSVIGNGTKISHLTYVGDSDVGEKVNFGCGTVTTNYDGHKKYRCTIGDNVFLGCNTNLIAPVTLGDGSYTAAGSTVTDDVPADALAIARARQTNIAGWAARFRKTWTKKS